MNTWIQQNTKHLTDIRKFLIECEYKPEFDNFPVRTIQKLLNGLEAELNRLQRENEVMKKTLISSNEKKE